MNTNSNLNQQLQPGDQYKKNGTAVIVRCVSIDDGQVKWKIDQGGTLDGHTEGTTSVGQFQRDFTRSEKAA